MGRPKLSAEDVEYIRAARTPLSLKLGDFGLWKLERQVFENPKMIRYVGFDSMTVLSRWTEATLHLNAAIS